MIIIMTLWVLQTILIFTYFASDAFKKYKENLLNASLL